MLTALWIIAVCEFIRVCQNSVQCAEEQRMRDNIYDQFTQKLCDMDSEFSKFMKKNFNNYIDDDMK